MFNMSRFILILFTIVLSCLLVFNNQSGVFERSIFIILTSIFVIAFSAVQVFSFSGEPYSLHKIFYLFSLFFFGIAPLIQYFNHISLWISIALTDNQYILTNTIVAFILVIYNFLYRLKRRLLRHTASKSSGGNAKIRIQKFNPQFSDLRQAVFLAFSVFSFFVIFYSNNFNWFLLFVRGGDLFNEIMEGSNNEFSSVQWLIINNFVRPMAMMSFMLYFINLNRLNFLGFVMLVIAVLTCMPSAMPRFAVAALYLPLAITFFQRFLRKYNFVLAFLIGFLVVFPFLDSFRNFSLNKGDFVLFNTDMFSQGHFDSYQNFAVIVSNDIVTYGYQLLGAFFFWIPRVVWPSKPVGSGTYLAKEMRLDFENISANYFAEGFINFSYLGIILFLIIIAVITAKLDFNFWCGSWKYNSSKRLLYLMSLGFLFFLLRGDLLNATAYFFGFYTSLMVISRITNVT